MGVQEDATKLREQADQARARADAATERAREADAAAYRRRQARAREFDKKFLREVNLGAIRKEVEPALQRFLEELLKQPWAKAYVEFRRAKYFMYDITQEIYRARQGLAPLGTEVQAPAMMTIPDNEFISQAQQSLDQEARRQALDEVEKLHERRDRYIEGGDSQ